MQVRLLKLSSLRDLRGVAKCLSTSKCSGKVATKYSIIGDPWTKHTREVQEFNIAYGHFFRLMGLRRIQTQQIEVAQVDVYINPLLAGQFQQELAGLSRRGRPCDEDWVFHGTGSTENVARIMLEGRFKVGGSDGVPVANGTAHCRGVYTAKDPDTPMTYGKATGQIILARALRGRRGDCAADDADSWEPSKDWAVFRRGQQLLPVYVAHYSCDSKASKDRPAASPPGAHRSAHGSSKGAPAGLGSASGGGFTGGGQDTSGRDAARRGLHQREAPGHAARPGSERAREEELVCRVV
jgi:hypothetical protein